MKKIDGIELLRMYRDREISSNTKIKSISETGNIYYMRVNSGADKIVYQDGSAVSTGYLTNICNSFEIIKEKPKEIEELELVSLEEFKTMTPEERYHVTAIEYDKINELTKAVNYLLEKESDE